MDPSGFARWIGQAAFRPCGLPSETVGAIDFRAEWERHYVASVRKATQRAYDLAAWLPPHEVYTILSEELRQHGVEPEPEAVFEGAMLISQGRKPAVLLDPE